MSKRTLKRLVKTGLAAGAHWSRLDQFVAARRGLDRAPLVLGYHRVVEDFEVSARDSIPSMLISVKTLEQQLDWVGRRFRFVSLDELARKFQAAERGDTTAFSGKPVAVVTFDDGYRDVFENAFPLLKRKGIPFTAYVVTDLVGTDRLQLHDELYLLVSALLALDDGERAECWKAVRSEVGDESGAVGPLLGQADDAADAYRATRLLLHGLDDGDLRAAVAVLRDQLALNAQQFSAFLSMDWDMLRTLNTDVGTVASHTRTHVLLAASTECVVREELEGSRRQLEQELGAPVRHLAYPDGSFDRATVRAVHAAGYETAVTTCQHIDSTFPALTIPRRLLWERSSHGSHGRFSPAILSCQLSGVFDIVDRSGYPS